MHWIYPAVGGGLFAFGLGAFGDVVLTQVIDSYREVCSIRYTTRLGDRSLTVATDHWRSIHCHRVHAQPLLHLGAVRYYTLAHQYGIAKYVYCHRHPVSGRVAAVSADDVGRQKIAPPFRGQLC